MKRTHESSLGTKIKRGLFFTLCVLGIIAAPFISLAETDTGAKYDKIILHDANFEVIKTTSIVKLKA